MNIYDQVIELTNHMTLAEKARLLQHLSTALRHDIETEAYKRMPWQQFIALTYGRLAGEPLERNRPLTTDVRDAIE